MRQELTEISFEQASDLVGESVLLESLDLGSCNIHKLNHGTHGLMVVTMSVDGRACACKV